MNRQSEVESLNPKMNFQAQAAAEERKIVTNRSKTFRRYELIRRKGNNEDTNINSDIGVTAHGARPDGTTTDARADEGNADDCADQREEDETRGGADQSAGKT